MEDLASLQKNNSEREVEFDDLWNEKEIEEKGYLEFIEDLKRRKGGLSGDELEGLMRYYRG